MRSLPNCAEAARFFRHLKGKISNKTGQTYSDTVTFVRQRLRFDLLKTRVISLCGFRGKVNPKTV